MGGIRFLAIFLVGLMTHLNAPSLSSGGLETVFMNYHNAASLSGGYETVFGGGNNGGVVARKTTDDDDGSSSSSRKGSRRPKKPLAILHVGPHKTGSSTVQKFLSDHRESIESEDGYVLAYLKSGRKGIKNMASLAICLNRDSNEVATQAVLRDWCTDFEGVERDFLELVRNVSAHNADALADPASSSSSLRHLVFTCEEFDRRMMDIEWLARRLQPDFEVRVVLYYRRFHDWIGSYFNQLAKTGLNRTFGWRVASSPNYYKKIGFPSISGWLDDHFDSYREQHAFPVYERYAEIFGAGNVTVLDFHDSNETVEESFACRGLPGADHACGLARSFKDGGTETISNTRVSLDWLRIVLGLTDRTEGRVIEEQERIVEERWDNISKRYPNPILWTTGDPEPVVRVDSSDGDGGSDVPIRRLCPTERHVGSILRSSIEFHRDLAPLLETSRANATNFSIEDDFAMQFNSSFCTLDVDRLFDIWEKRPWYADMIAMTPDKPKPRKKKKKGGDK